MMFWQMTLILLPMPLWRLCFLVIIVGNLRKGYSPKPFCCQDSICRHNMRRLSRPRCSRERKGRVKWDESKCMQADNNKERIKQIQAEPDSDSLAGNWSAAFITTYWSRQTKTLNSLIHSEKKKREVVATDCSFEQSYSETAALA